MALVIFLPIIFFLALSSAHVYIIKCPLEWNPSTEKSTWMIVTAVEFDISTRNMIKFEQKKNFLLRPSFFLFFIFSFRKFCISIGDLFFVGKVLDKLIGNEDTADFNQRVFFILFDWSQVEKSFNLTIQPIHSRFVWIKIIKHIFDIYSGTNRR